MPFKLPTVGELLARHITAIIAQDSGLPSLRVCEEVTLACVAAFKWTDELIERYQRGLCPRRSLGSRFQPPC